MEGEGVKDRAFCPPFLFPFLRRLIVVSVVVVLLKLVG